MINITGHTGLTGLLGSPVAHSVSPLMHNEAFRYLGLDYVYLCFDVTEETLPQAVEGLKACGIKGFNLTMPNKNKIVELLDELSPTAQLIGAVNTVRNDNGKLKGFNTDGYGFTQSARDAGCDVKGRTITVMGDLRPVRPGGCKKDPCFCTSYQPLLGTCCCHGRKNVSYDRM